jgi:hypothetical protein
MLHRRVQPLINLHKLFISDKLLLLDIGMWHFKNKIVTVLFYLKVKGQQPNLQFLLQKFKFESTVQSNGQGHSVINHCDRHITLLSDTDRSFHLLNLFTYFDMPFRWYISVSNTLNVKEMLKIYLIEQKIYLNHQDEWYVYHSDLSRYVSDCTVTLYIGV